jgi:membrane-bound lytic murein transglycosylase B
MPHAVTPLDGPRLTRRASLQRSAQACVVATLFVATSALSTGARAQSGSARAAGDSTGRLYAGRDDAMAMAHELAAQRSLDAAWVRHWVGQAQRVPTISRLMRPAPRGTPKNWRVYRSRFVEPIRIRAGVAFMRSHAAALRQAQDEFGVPADIIVAIIGVETLYGREQGTFRVLDALVNLSLDFPPEHPRAAERAAFFRSELGHFLSWLDRSGTSPSAPLGSFAGAMGMPQFMPSSVVRYALDYDRDGRLDLSGSAVDAIGSVANYFKAFGWVPGMPTHYGVMLDGPGLDMAQLLAPDILPTFSATQMADLGARLDAAGQRHGAALALIELENGGAANSYVAGTENFYVITRYNWSSYYAMAVIDLAQAISQAAA